MNESIISSLSLQFQFQLLGFLHVKASFVLPWFVSQTHFQQPPPSAPTSKRGKKQMAQPLSGEAIMPSGDQETLFKSEERVRSCLTACSSSTYPSPLPSPRIKHPNIVSLEDIFESTSHLYLVMQLWVPLSLLSALYASTERDKRAIDLHVLTRNRKRGVGWGAESLPFGW